MKNFRPYISKLIGAFVIVMILFACEEVEPFNGFDGIQLPDKHGILEVDFELPEYSLIQNGIRRSDLAVCNTMYEMNKGVFFYHSNVSDAKQVYQIVLPEGKYFYQAVITCSLGGDSCMMGGFPYGQGGMKYAFDEVMIKAGEKTYSLPVFQ
jgi:hypothetical protein